MTKNASSVHSTFCLPLDGLAQGLTDHEQGAPISSETWSKSSHWIARNRLTNSRKYLQHDSLRAKEIKLFELNFQQGIIFHEVLSQAKLQSIFATFV